MRSATIATGADKSKRQKMHDDIAKKEKFGRTWHCAHGARNAEEYALKGRMMEKEEGNQEEKY